MPPKHYSRALIYKRQRLAFLVSSSSPSYTMDIVIIGHGQFIVDHMSDIGNIKTASSDVGSYENLDIAFFEKAQCSLPPGMILVAVDRFGFEAHRDQTLGKAFDAMFSLTEDKDFVEFLLFQEIAQDIEFILTCRDTDDVLIDILRGVASLHGDAHRCLQEFAD